MYSLRLRGNEGARESRIFLLKSYKKVRDRKEGSPVGTREVESRTKTTEKGGEGNVATGSQSGSTF